MRLEAELRRWREAEYYLDCVETPALADGVDPAAALPAARFGDEADADADAGGPVGDWHGSL